MKILSDNDFILGDYEDILIDTPLFEGVEKTDISAMLLCLQAELRQYEKGEYIMKEGDPAKYMGIVLEGTIQIMQEDFYGNRSILNSVTVGNVFAESFACANINSLTVSVCSQTRSMILLLHTDQIFSKQNCEFHHILIENLLHLVANKNVFINNRLCNTIHKTTREKILAFLMDEKRKNHSNSFTINFDRQELADYLGVDRSAMSNEIGKLQKEGILLTKRNHFELLRLDA